MISVAFSSLRLTVNAPRAMGASFWWVLLKILFREIDLLIFSKEETKQKTNKRKKNNQMSHKDIFILLIYWSIMILAPVMSKDLKFSRSKLKEGRITPISKAIK